MNKYFLLIVFLIISNSGISQIAGRNGFDSSSTSFAIQNYQYNKSLSGRGDLKQKSEVGRSSNLNGNQNKKFPFGLPNTGRTIGIAVKVVACVALLWLSISFMKDIR